MRDLSAPLAICGTAMRLITTMLVDDIRDKTVETTSFVDAVIAAERMADDIGRPVYLREIAPGAWRVREAPLPYYSSSEIEIRPEGYVRLAMPVLRTRKAAPKPEPEPLSDRSDPWAGVDYSRKRVA